MILHCLHCKEQLLVEAAARAIVRCPVCDFLFALSPGGRPEVPTFSEESSLTKVDARRAVTPSGADRADHTIVGDTTDAFGALPVPAGKELFLEVLAAGDQGPAKGAIFRFAKGRLVLGRTDADVILEDDRISRKHALIEAISRENMYLKDLASTNGTYLNGHRVLMKKLADGDEIRLGSVTLRFRAADV
jgi:ribosomal protein S27E